MQVAELLSMGNDAEGSLQSVQRQECRNAAEEFEANLRRGREASIDELD